VVIDLGASQRLASTTDQASKPKNIKNMGNPGTRMKHIYMIHTISEKVRWCICGVERGYNQFGMIHTFLHLVH
jgi:hypothetical protein